MICGGPCRRHSRLLLRVQERRSSPSAVGNSAGAYAGSRMTYSSSLVKEEALRTEKDRTATVRLYRILQRTCRSFDPDSSSSRIMLQSRLQATSWGRHSMTKNSSPMNTQNKPLLEELFRFFYIWNQSAEDDLLDDEDDDDLEKRIASHGNSSTASSSPAATIDAWYRYILERQAATIQEQSKTKKTKVGVDTSSPLSPMTTDAIWTTPQHLRGAIRAAFRLSHDPDDTAEKDQVLDTKNLHKWAINAIRFLQEQQVLWSHSSSQETEGVLVTATSRCIGTTTPISSLPPAATAGMLESKYRFAYRVRVENVGDQHVQLLGRYWHIQEIQDAASSPHSMKRTKHEKISSTSPAPIVVDAPVTGAVGHLPVLGPGQVFQYMSGTDLATTQGVMEGHFYLARVPPGTPSAKSGDSVEALNCDDKLQAVVAAFPLEAN